MYDFFKLVHVLAAMVWFGAGVTITILFARVGMSGNRAHEEFLSAEAEWFGMRVFNAAAITTLLAGIVMVLDAEFIEFSQAWISIGFLGIIASLGIGHGVITGSTKKLRTVIDAQGPEAAEANALRQRIAMFSMLDLLILVIVIWAMVYKPGL